MKLSDFLFNIGRPVAFYPGLAKALGSIKQAVFVCQLAYWKDKGDDPDGWIYKTAEEIESETALTYKEQTKVRADLVEKKALQERYARTEHQMYFRIDWDIVNTLWEEHLTKSNMPKGKVASSQKSGGILPKGVSLNSNTETTTYITAFGNLLSEVNAIPFCDYPDNVREMCFEFCKLYHFNAPNKPKGKSKSQFSFWIVSLTELVTASGEFGIDALREHRKDFESHMEDHGGIAPFTISSPQSLVNVVRGKAAQMRTPQNKESYVRPEYQLHKTDENKAKYVPNPQRPRILSR